MTVKLRPREDYYNIMNYCNAIIFDDIIPANDTQIKFAPGQIDPVWLPVRKNPFSSVFFLVLPHKLTLVRFFNPTQYCSNVIVANI